MTGLAFLLAALAPAAQAPPVQVPTPAPAPAAPSTPPPQILFTGRTTADANMIREAMEEVLRFSAHHLKCDTLNAVKASIQPEGWQPSDPNYRFGPPATRYERWEVAQCGRVVPFLVGFWPAPEGKSEFQVAHPFPVEPAKP